MEFPPLNFLDMPFTHIKALTKSEDGKLLIVHPDASFDLTHLSPREKWKYEWQKRRLAKKGIVLAEVKGEIGSLRR